MCDFSAVLLATIWVMDCLSLGFILIILYILHILALEWNNKCLEDPIMIWKSKVRLLLADFHFYHHPKWNHFSNVKLVIWSSSNRECQNILVLGNCILTVISLDQEFSIGSSLHSGQSATSEDIFGCHSPGVGKLLSSKGERPEMLLNALEWTGEPFTT